MGASAVPNLAQEDLLRAHFYGLLARLLAAPPDGALLAQLAGFDRDDTELGRALGRLADLAKAADGAAVEDEYNALFIGLGRGELLPYGSYYQSGTLHDRPLAALRQDLAQLGIAKAEDNCEPEDHVAILCDIMQGLIDGRFGAAGDLARQRQFFEAHLGPWLERFFTDLESASSARLYAAVGTVGRLFAAIEADAFAMLD